MAQQCGFDGFIMLNLYPVRATDPQRPAVQACPMACERNLEEIEKIIAQYPTPPSGLPGVSW